VNAWLAAASALLILVLPCAVAAMRGGMVERLLGVELGGVLTTLSLLMLAEGFDRSIYFDLALVFAVMSFVGSLAFVRFLERWV